MALSIMPETSLFSRKPLFVRFQHTQKLRTEIPLKRIFIERRSTGLVSLKKDFFEATIIHKAVMTTWGIVKIKKAAQTAAFLILVYWKSRTPANQTRSRH